MLAVEQKYILHTWIKAQFSCLFRFWQKIVYKQV